MSTSEALPVPRELDNVTNLLDEHLDSLAYGSSLIQNAALQAAKHIFDTCTFYIHLLQAFLNNIISTRN